MLRCNIAVLVSGGGTNLQALIDAEANGIIKDGHISLVLSNKPDVYALKRAEAAGIESIVVNKKQLGDKFEGELLRVLEEHDIDLIVLAGFMCILSKSFTDKYKDKIINVHPSLIPSFCGEGFYGLAVHRAALDYGVKVTGATVHYVNEIPDGGKIIAQKAVEVQPGDTPETLQRRVMERAEWIILPAAAQAVCEKILGEKNK